MRRHHVTLLPLQLALLNGSTPDFDGSIPTTLPLASENSTYAADLQECGSATLGVQAMGQGRVNNPPPNEHYTIQTLVVAKAPAALAGIQYNWKRYISRRSWYIQKNTAGTAWTVTWRSSRGTTGPADDTGGADFYSTTPSSTKHELYFQDTSALGYGNFPNDTASGFMKIGDYIHEEKAFLYILQTSFDGTNWTDGVNATYAQSITIQYKATGGTAATDWNGVPSLQGGNTFVQGSITPIITTAKIRAIVGGSLPINIDPNANNQ